VSTLRLISTAASRNEEMISASFTESRDRGRERERGGEREREREREREYVPSFIHCLHFKLLRADARTFFYTLHSNFRDVISIGLSFAKLNHE